MTLVHGGAQNVMELDSQPSQGPRSLRDQHQQLTRQLIFRALIDVVNEEGVHAFTVQRVADQAGVSHRTVYRHFPTRQAMLDGFGEWSEEYNARHGLGLPDTVEAIQAHIKAIFQSFDRDKDSVRAIVQIRLLTGMEEQTRRQRTGWMRELLGKMAPNLPSAEIDRATYAIRGMVTASNWYQMKLDFGIDGKESGDAVAYAVELILADLKRRNEEAAGQRTVSPAKGTGHESEAAGT
jgi:AcrR family transcriptional regulator